DVRCQGIRDLSDVRPINLLSRPVLSSPTPTSSPTASAQRHARPSLPIVQQKQTLKSPLAPVAARCAGRSAPQAGCGAMGKTAPVVEGTYLAANTCGMGKKPTPPRQHRWDVCRATAKLGTVKAASEAGVVEKAAKEFKVIASKLTAVQRR